MGRHGRFAFRHGRFFAPGIGLFAFGGPFYSDYGYDDGCWVNRRILTSVGWRWRLINVCY